MFQQEIFQRRLKEERLKKSLTQKQVGEGIGLKSNTVNQWETGERLPSLESLCRLSHFFDVTIDYLLGQSDRKK